MQQLFFDMYTSMCGDDDNARNDGDDWNRRFITCKLSTATVYTVSW